MEAASFQEMGIAAGSISALFWILWRILEAREESNKRELEHSAKEREELRSAIADQTSMIFDRLHEQEQECREEITRMRNDHKEERTQWVTDFNTMHANQLSLLNSIKEHLGRPHGRQDTVPRDSR